MENLAPIMALVEPKKRENVWSDVLPDFCLKMSGDVYMKCRTSALYYISYWVKASWRDVHEHIYSHNQTGALERVKPFLSPISSDRGTVT